MAQVEIEGVQVEAPPEEVRGFALDAPVAGEQRHVYDIEIAGWVLGREAPVLGIEVEADGAILRRAPLDQPRPDVAAAHPAAPGLDRPGFRLSVGVVGLEPGVALGVRAVLADERRELLGTIRFSHRPLRTGFAPRLQPLMLTTIGRAGTTWTMLLLSKHPAIVVHRWYPYELRVARYWWHALGVLAGPTDPHHSARADAFQTSQSWVGHNPFYPAPVVVTPGLGEWFGRDFVEDLGAFYQRKAEEVYGRIAAAQGQDRPVFFAEKHRPDRLPWLVRELYPGAKELFLVRDFRDVASSMLAFNAKQGRRVFGAETVESDEAFVRHLRGGAIDALARSWAKRGEQAHLIRYEDLIARPVATLRGALAHLGLANDEATIAEMVELASRENPQMRRHRTSSDVAGSVGRWRASLSPSVQAVCAEVMGDVLGQFGYGV